MFGYLLNGAQNVSDCLFVNHMYQELTELVGFSLDNCVMECGIPTFVLSVMKRCSKPVILETRVSVVL